ncbi:hypothetical protein DMENIID0001_056310 [Sergentomyia squamirostris]
MTNLRPLPELLQLKAMKENNEVPERIQDDLMALRSWIEKQPHLRARTDDQFLVAFLRGCKYSMEQVKKKIDLYYSSRSAFKEIISDRDPLTDENVDIIQSGRILPLLEPLGSEGPSIAIFRFGHWDLSKLKIIDGFRFYGMIIDILLLEDDHLTISGGIGIFDFANVPMTHFLQFTPTFVKKVMVIYQDAMPVRLKGFHCINTTPGFEIMFNLFKGFLNEKNRNKVYVHSDLESLYKHIPQKHLPTEYGGEGGSIKDLTTCWENKFLEYRDYLMEESKYGTDEKKRPGLPKTEETLFGIDGSFRKLNVD